jgi:hypothetical protein
MAHELGHNFLIFCTQLRKVIVCRPLTSFIARH